MGKKKRTVKQQQKQPSAPVFDVEQREKSSAEELAEMDFKRQAAEHASGRTETTYGVWGPIWRFMKWYDAKRTPHRFKKKTYMWLMLFTGWMGGHRWYQGRRYLALLETLFFWTGVPLIMLVTDFMEVYPIKPDEEGFIVLK